MTAFIYCAIWMLVILLLAGNQNNVLFPLLLVIAVFLTGCDSKKLEINGCLVDATAYYIASQSALKLASLEHNEILIYERDDGTSHAGHVWQFEGNAYFRDAEGSTAIFVIEWTPQLIARAVEPRSKITRAFFQPHNEWATPEK